VKTDEISAVFDGAKAPTPLNQQPDWVRVRKLDIAFIPAS
jgi:hypothetical protein